MKIVPVMLPEKSVSLGTVNYGKIVRLLDSSGDDFLSAVAESGENFYLVFNFKGDKKLKEHVYLMALDGQLVRARQSTRHAVVYDVGFHPGKPADKLVRASELVGGSIALYGLGIKQPLTCMIMKGGTPPPGGKVAMVSLVDGEHLFVDDDLMMTVYPEAQYTIEMSLKK